ncbi:MAG: pilus assembly protein TadG-related protein [Gemmatimonadota bacterium]
MSLRDTSTEKNFAKRFLTRLWGDDKAVTLVFTALTVSVVFGAAAVAVDLGMLTTARVQSQRAADAAALAGAGELAKETGTSTSAREEAKRYANMHNILTEPVTVDNGDVDVNTSDGSVTVHVDHTTGTLFARILGITSATVGATATAQALPAGGAACPLPIMAVDKWIDDGDGLYQAGEEYQSCRDGEPCTGFTTSDEGTLLEVKSQNTSEANSSTRTCGAENPEWYCWVDNVVGGGSVGAAELEDIIVNGCANTEFKISIDNDLESSPGNKQSVVQKVKKLIDDNGGTSITWNQGRGCVWDGTMCVDGDHPRIRPMPVTDPTTIEQSGENARATVDNFVGVFIEKVADAPDAAHGSGGGGQWNIYVRLLDGAVDGVGATDGHPNSLLKSIVLVK